MIDLFRFNPRDSDGVAIDENRASCIMPTFTEAEGWVDFEVSLNGGPYYWKGMFYVDKLKNRKPVKPHKLKFVNRNPSKQSSSFLVQGRVLS